LVTLSVCTAAGTPTRAAPWQSVRDSTQRVGRLRRSLSDRMGRVRVLQLTILWFSFFTLLCGFAQDGNQLLVFRALMGFGFGGEWVAGAVLMGETVRAKFRGRAVGSVQSGWAVGWGLAVLLSVLTEQLFAPEMAWRVLFGLGVLPAAGDQGQATQRGCLSAWSCPYRGTTE